MYSPSAGSGASAETQDTETKDPDAAVIPFILGTTTSDEQIARLQKIINRMVDGQKWGSRDRFTERKGTDLEQYWQSLFKRYGKNDGDGSDGGGEIEGEAVDVIEDEVVDEGITKKRRIHY